ncbi:MAG TPA: malate synthase A [Holophagaceae bacterium]|jgi:malate synthase|nr:malate synthase A [Holophagaceae bacterium]
MHLPAKSPDGLALLDPEHSLRHEVLPPQALAFLVKLTRDFAPELRALLTRRLEVQSRLDAGGALDFLPETKEVRAGTWRVAPLPDDLLDRRVEITGPPEPKMIINALNSGASCFMADFEDSCAPAWDALLEGQRALMAAVRRTLVVDDAAKDKTYRLNERTAVLHVRPRGLHLEERHLLVDGRPIPGAIFDAGLFLFHNAAELVSRGSGPYLYLPKLEDHREACWWNALLHRAEELLGLEPGSARTTVLIETLPAAFQMDEILFELKDRAAGLNCGRWDYIFSFIKKRRMDPSALLPDRARVTMDQPALRAYAQLLVKTCHRRGVHAMGGMAAQIPIKDDAAANALALERVRQDKLREVREGHDGTWVAHPGLVPLAKEVFDAGVPGPNQLQLLREDVAVRAADLLAVPEGLITREGLRRNVRVALRYLEAWLEGRGCVPIDHLMEDAATAEISRAQLWQWARHGALLDDGARVDHALLRAAFDQEMKHLQQELGIEHFRRGRFHEARLLLEDLVTAPVLEDFLTIPAYGHLLASELMARVS